MKRLLLKCLNAAKYARRRAPRLLPELKKAREARRWNRDRPRLFAALKAEIEAGNAETLSPCDITITINSRYLGIEDNLLDAALASLAEHTREKDRVEVMIKVDDDDYLPYHARILRKYRDSLRIRAFVSPRGRGYEDLVRFHAFLIEKASPGSKVWQGACEGSRFQLPGWDRMLMKAVEASGKDLFVGTQATFEASKAVHGPIEIYKPAEIYHLGAEDYPCVSMKLLNVIEGAVQGRPNWSCFGGTSFSDAFMADLIRLSHELYGHNIHVQLPRYVRRTGSFNWSLDPERLRKRTSILAEFFNEANRDARRRVAHAVHLALEAKTPDASPAGIAAAARS